MTCSVTPSRYTRVHGARNHAKLLQDEWVSFPGGELEGRRPKVLCPACREALKREASGSRRHAPGRPPRPLCFQCYRAELDRERALRAAGQLDTASEARFQAQLPFEPVNTRRLGDAQSAERTRATRGSLVQGAGRFVDKRRRAQMAARHALQAIAAGLQARSRIAPALRADAMAAALHAAELQLPESWLPFVVSR